MLSRRLPSVVNLRTLGSGPVCLGNTFASDTARQIAAGDGAKSLVSPAAWPSAAHLRSPCSSSYGQIRGKKTKTVVKLEDLPQGAIQSDPRPVEEEETPGPVYPTTILQARRNMQKFDNCVLLTRVGGFYEMYFEHAQEYGPLLNLKLASKKTNAGAVPMAGFPFFQLDRYLKILVQDLNRYVAIAEEFAHDDVEKVKSGGLLHDRRIARIITPGTLIDENFIDPYANNYVLAVHLSGTGDAEGTALGDLPLGLAWLDLSTGRFFTQTTTMMSLGSILSRVSPREIVLDQDLQSQKSHDIFSILAEDRYLVTYAPQGELQSLADWAPLLESDIPPQIAESFTTDEVKAGSLVLHYVKDRLRGLSMKLQPPLRYESLQVMNIDKNSMRALEIKQTIRDGAFRGSLLHAIRRTVTKSGARLLNEWLSAPSTSLEVINFRQSLVARFLQDEDLRESIVLQLGRSHDAQRLVQKFALGRGDPDDLLDLAKTIKATSDINTLLNHALDSADDSDCLVTLTGRISLERPLDLARRIRESVDEEGLVQQHHIQDSEAGAMVALAQAIVTAEGTEDDSSVLPKKATAKKRPSASFREHYGEDNENWIMRSAASPNLTRLHADLATLTAERESLATTLRARLSAPSLTLRWTPGLGHICHVKGKDTAALKNTPLASARRTTRAFHQPEWTTLGHRLDAARAHIRTAEAAVLAALRAAVVHALVPLRRSAAVLDELDIATSLAALARDHGLVRPLVTHRPAHHVLGGRHPAVESGLAAAGTGRTFTPNDCLVGAAGHARAWLVTGPNMAGKSTFLRQNALLTILAQIGAYVPARHAEVGIVDAIYSRVGSADSLYRDQSTFMVEMLETAAILRCATPRSFVVMDEIGRGTTPEDGAAVAYATLLHLVRENRCRTLFATHFHSLADLAAADGLTASAGGEGPAVEMYCTDVVEDAQGGFIYDHKLRKGINRHSHALKVGRLAGLPEKAIQAAQRVLDGSIGKVPAADASNVMAPRNIEAKVGEAVG